MSSPQFLCLVASQKGLYLSRGCQLLALHLAPNVVRSLLAPSHVKHILCCLALALALALVVPLFCALAHEALLPSDLQATTVVGRGEIEKNYKTAPMALFKEALECGDSVFKKTSYPVFPFAASTPIDAVRAISKNINTILWPPHITAAVTEAQQQNNVNSQRNAIASYCTNGLRPVIETYRQKNSGELEYTMGTITVLFNKDMDIVETWIRSQVLMQTIPGEHVCVYVCMYNIAWHS